MHKLPFDISRAAVDAASNLTLGTLHSLRDLLSTGMKLSGETLQWFSDISVLNNTQLADALRQTGSALLEIETSTEENLAVAITASREAFNTAIEAVNLADEVTRRTLFENIHVASVVGESFVGVRVSQLKPSFRLHGEDVVAAEIIEDFKKSGMKQMVICVPGLFCDENLWYDREHPDNQYSFDKIFTEFKRYPVKLRFNPGHHISENGKALISLLRQLIENPEIQNLKESRLDVVTYSQGGLILRSALYQSREQGDSLAQHIRSALLIGSPDGGSYLEKLGFWAGLLLELSLLPDLKLLGMLGNRRSDAIKDLSHGVIREEDWQSKWHIHRYFNELYFGELDDVDAYQLFSLISEEDDPLHSWLGDGIVETASLMYLTEKVYRRKSNPDKRVKYVSGRSHFQVLHNKDAADMLKYMLKKRVR